MDTSWVWKYFQKIETKRVKSSLQIIDSSATIHVCHDQSQFMNIKFGNYDNVKIANGLQIQVVHVM